MDENMFSNRVFRSGEKESLRYDGKEDPTHWYFIETTDRDEDFDLTIVVHSRTDFVPYVRDLYYRMSLPGYEHVEYRLFLEYDETFKNDDLVLQYMEHFKILPAIPNEDEKLPFGIMLEKAETNLMLFCVATPRTTQYHFSFRLLDGYREQYRACICISHRDNDVRDWTEYQPGVNFYIMDGEGDDVYYKLERQKQIIGVLIEFAKIDLALPHYVNKRHLMDCPGFKSLSEENQYELRSRYSTFYLERDKRDRRFYTPDQITGIEDMKLTFKHGETISI